MVIDCDRCEVRGDACGDCVVGVLLGVPGVRQRAAPDARSGAAAVHLEAPERRALAVLADQGLVPRLPPRLLTAGLKAFGREPLVRRSFSWYLEQAPASYATAPAGAQSRTPSHSLP